MWHRDLKWTNAAGKMALIDFLDKELPWTFNLSKTQYLHSAIKWTAIRWGVPDSILSSHSIRKCSFSKVFNLKIIRCYKFHQSDRWKNSNMCFNLHFPNCWGRWAFYVCCPFAHHLWIHYSYILSFCYLFFFFVLIYRNSFDIRSFLPYSVLKLTC